MNTSCHALVWAGMLLGAVAGCQRGTKRTEYLPSPPPGWKWQEEAREETVAEAGIRVSGTYVSVADNDAAQGIDKVRITIAWVKEGAAKEAERELRQLPEGGQLMEAIDIAGRKAMASAPFYKVQIACLTIAPDCKVDIVLSAHEKPAPEAAGRMRKVLHLFAEKIDYETLKDKK